MTWLDDLPPVAALDCAGAEVPDGVLRGEEPLLLRGLVASWPALACDHSVESAASYLRRFHSPSPLTVYVGDASIDGRFFYDEPCTGFNFRAGKAALAQVLARLGQPGREESLATIYVGSTPVDQWLPGFRAENDLRWPVTDALASFWLGSETCVSAHYDFPNNIACVVAGRRRFTLLPPEQIGNLYVGPVDKTPSGQPISLVDFRHPNFKRHPRFRQAQAHARTALLQPGDALFIPSMWWHHVESLSPFNLLVNYWWCSSPTYLGTPSHALLYAMLALRDLPQHQKEAWRAIYNHYVFDADEDVYRHIPEQGRGILATLDEDAARKLRGDLLNKLNQ